MRATPIETLRRRLADVLAPRVDVDPAEWAAGNVRLSDEHEAARGPYDLSGRPWWAGILRAVADPEVRTITIPASTQVGKTLSLCAILLYLARNSPASALVALPDKPSAAEFRDRLYSLAKESGFSVPPVWRWNLRYCQIGAMRVYLAWSGSRQGLRGRRCKYVFLSEVDVYQTPAHGDPIEAARQRVKAFPRHLILAESSPVAEESRVDSLEQSTDQRRWFCRCPECGTWQELRFFVHQDGELAGRCGIGGLKDEAGNWRDPDAARGAAHYVCRSGCRIGDDRKAAFVRSGVWVPRGAHVDDCGQVRGAGRVRDVGFRLWAAHSAASWGTIAAEYLRARLNGTVSDWFGNWLGLCYRTLGKIPEWQEIGARLAFPGYTRGQVPGAAWFVTASCDVQEDEVYCVVRAWGDGKRSWLVDWFVFARESADAGDLVKSDLRQIDEYVMATDWPVAGGKNPRGKTRLPIALLGIDAKYRTSDVHQWILAAGKPARIRAIQGDGLLRGVRYKGNVVHEARRAKADGSKEQYEGGLELWSLNSTDFRRDLATRFRAEADAAGAWLLPSDIMESGRHYLRQLVNEPPTYIRGTDGRQKLVYKERDRHLGHDFWDCEVNGLALADMVVDELFGETCWDAREWSRVESAKQRRAEGRPPAKRSTSRAAR